MTFEVARRDEVARGVASGAYHLGLVDGIAAPSDPLKLPDVGLLRTSAVAQDEAGQSSYPATTRWRKRKRLGLAALVDARWIDAPAVSAPLAELRAAIETDVSGRRSSTPAPTCSPCSHWFPPATASPYYPLRSHRPTGIAKVPVDAPRLVHRVELLHGQLDSSAASALAELLDEG